MMREKMRARRLSRRVLRRWKGFPWDQVKGKYENILKIYTIISSVLAYRCSSIGFDHGELGQAIPLFGGDAGSVWATTFIVERGE
jgi:hypothetical protein